MFEKSHCRDGRRSVPNGYLVLFRDINVELPSSNVPVCVICGHMRRGRRGRYLTDLRRNSLYLRQHHEQQQCT
jgi:hypothetical protein